MQPFLKMVKSFIFTGDFEDPHEEFFVSKIYRKKNVINEEYVLMMSEEVEEKVPCFMVPVAPIIFKAGSSLNLLSQPDDFKDLDLF